MAGGHYCWSNIGEENKEENKEEDKEGPDYHCRGRTKAALAPRFLRSLPFCLFGPFHRLKRRFLEAGELKKRPASKRLNRGSMTPETGMLSEIGLKDWSPN